MIQRYSVLYLRGLSLSFSWCLDLWWTRTETQSETADGCEMGRHLIFLIPLLGYSQCHVSLTFPPARDLNLDFLDNIRTPPPCGMPKGESKMSLLAGSSFNVTWHLGYPHRGEHCMGGK